MTARTYNRLTATAATAIFVVLSVILASFSTRETTDLIQQRPSTFFTDPTGARALLMVMKRFVAAAEPWRRPLSLLSLPSQTDAASTLIVAGPRLPITKSESEHLERWLNAGGQLILLTGNGWPTRQRRAADDERAEPDIKTPEEKREEQVEKFLSRYAPKLRWTKPAKFRIDQASGTSVPAADIKLRWQRSFTQTQDLDIIAEVNNQAVAVAIPVGQGRIVAVADPTMVSNGSLRKADNAVWLVGLATTWANGRVLFDEYHHGFGQKRGTAELTRAFLMTPWGWCVLQFAAAGLLYIFAYRRRFGRISEPPMANRASSLELLEARAGVFQTAAARGLAAQLIVQNLYQALTKSHGKSVDAAHLSGELATLAQSGGAGKYSASLQSMTEKLRGGARLSDRELIEIGQTAGEILKGQRL